MENVKEFPQFNESWTGKEVYAQVLKFMDILADEVHENTMVAKSDIHITNDPRLLECGVWVPFLALDVEVVEERDMDEWQFTKLKWSFHDSEGDLLGEYDYSSDMMSGRMNEYGIDEKLFDVLQSMIGNDFLQQINERECRH
ncbi:hypothetical protein [Bifidobacterium magnum]|uniref:Uncharacterized protein n=1 Tax=Bifidobacterium magnum TaxID=1692 RepID=A0A087B664_9BIFI|nr:hypothetical protein [Bifidobacterium magnum]KFI66514.1 hypothetical protein BMAGN_1422 [Bifidobacterium magnum]